MSVPLNREARTIGGGSGVTALASLMATYRADRLNNLEYFLRSLSAVYALAESSACCRFQFCRKLWGWVNAIVDLRAWREGHRLGSRQRESRTNQLLLFLSVQWRSVRFRDCLGSAPVQTTSWTLTAATVASAATMRFSVRDLRGGIDSAFYYN